MSAEFIEIDGYRLSLDRLYDRESNLWVAPLGAGRVRIGFDPLGAETTGDVVAVSFPPPGSPIPRGGVLATVEAAKFVGPVLAPVAGTLRSVNERLSDQPGLLNGDPLGTWLAELHDVESDQLDALLAGRAELERWFTAAVERFRRQGAIAQ
jgi:glycine cleavage system H protein